MRPAAEELPPRTNGKDHQHLGRDRFDEPAGLKKRRAGAEQIQQSVEGQKVENGTDRSEDQHEPLDQLDVPLHRQGDSFRIDAVERDRDLRHVVEQIVQQYLDRQHRQERQEQRRAGHAEHVAEVRA